MQGGRLEANSLVGVTMNAAALKRMGFQYKFVYGFCPMTRLRSRNRAHRAGDSGDQAPAPHPAGR